MILTQGKSMRVVALDCDITKDLNKFKRDLFLNYPNYSYKKVIDLIYDHFVNELGYSPKIVIEGIKMLSNTQKRRTRCLEKTKVLVNDNRTVWFGTLTFTNEVLDSTSADTRRRYVSRYLKSISPAYIANIDYGDKDKNPDSNEREHYHCMIACDEMPKSWTYGFCKFKLVPKDMIDIKRTSKYIVKLTNHAMKLERTGKAKRLIYSRGVVLPYWLLDD